MDIFINSHIEKENSQRLALEELTKMYLKGDVGLKDYQKRINMLERRLDLRRVASKLKPIAVVVEEYIR